MTEIRMDPIAYMAARPDHNDDDGVDYLPDLESTDDDAQLRPQPQSEDESDVDVDIDITPVKWIDTTYRATNKTEDKSQRRTVNVYKDEGIWILLDEGCNSN